MGACVLVFANEFKRYQRAEARWSGLTELPDVTDACWSTSIHSPENMVLDRDSLIRRLDEVSPRQKEMVILRAARFELAEITEITEITGATSAKAERLKALCIACG
jgi:DNA-directed RNA polymerase specialized sigma24 family protein